MRSRFGPVLVAAAMASLLVAGVAGAATPPMTGAWARVGPAAPLLMDVGAGYGARFAADGRLYVYGAFADACGDPTADAIVVYDPATGDCHGLGSNGAGDGAFAGGSINAIAWVNGVLFVGGLFTGAAGVSGIDYLAAWNGTAWSGRGKVTGEVMALASRAGTLYVGGSFTSAGNHSGFDHIAALTGTTWSAVGFPGDVNQPVTAIAAPPDGRVFIGGYFQDAGGDAAADLIAVSDGVTGWKALDESQTGVHNGHVRAIAVAGTRVVFGGEFSDLYGDPLADQIIEWTGAAWKHLGPNASKTDGALNSYLPGEVPVRDISLYGSMVVVGGDFYSALGNASLTGVAAWNGSAWLALGSPGTLWGKVRDVEIIGRTLYVAGTFNTMGGVPGANGIAAFGLLAAPSVPRSLAGTSGAKKVTLTWAAPATTNGSAVTDYIIEYRKKGTTAWKTFADGVKTTRSAVVTGLTSGTTYELRVRAKNAWGTGATSTVLVKKAG